MSKDSRGLIVPGSLGKRFTRAMSLLAGLALTLAAAPAFAAAWTPSGVPFVTASGDQSAVKAVSDGRGGFIAAWIDARNTPHEIYCQRVDSTGVAQWTANGVLVTTGVLDVSDLTASPDGADGVLLAWVANRAVTRQNVYVQRLNASGVAQWAANGVLLDAAAADTAQSTPSIVTDGAGGAIVAWVDGRGSDNEIYVQRVLAAGTVNWTAGGVLMASTGNPQQAPRVLDSSASGAFVSWEDVGTSVQTYFQRLDAVGAVQWTAGGVALPTPRGQNAFMGRAPSNDSLLVGWFATVSNSDRIYGDKLDPSGVWIVAAGNNLRQTNALPVGMVPQAAGGGLLVYADAASITALPMNSRGNASVASSVSLATGQTLNAASGLSVVSDATGGLYCVWSSASIVLAQHVTSLCVTDWGATPVTVASIGSPSQTTPTSAPGFDLLAAWVDGRNSGTTGADLFTQRVSPSGVTGSYFRILASTGSGTGTFSEHGARTWVRAGDTLRVRFNGTSGQHVDHVIVGATTFGPVPNYTFHNVTADSTLAAHFSAASINTQVTAVASSYRAFSVPSTLSPNTVASQFANLMPYDITRWRLGHWEADDSTYLEPSGLLTTVVPGAGYWFIGLKDTTLSFTGLSVAEVQFTLAMLGGAVSHHGWTQFGSPFRFPVAVSQLRITPGPDVPITDIANTATDPTVFEFNPGTSSYNAVTLLLPGRAYWLWRQSNTAVSLNVPWYWNPVSTGGLAPNTANSGDWNISVSAQSGERAAQLVFGVAPVTAGSWNHFSSHQPPASPEPGLTLVARVSDWGADNGDYASVFRPDAETLSWDFDASAPAGLTEAAVTFAFTNLPSDRRVVLSEPASGWTREVTTETRVPLVFSASTRHLRLEVLAGSVVTPGAPLATALRAAGPNPFTDATTLSFALARGGPLRWDVFDLAGRRVVSGARTFDPGEHVVSWDGRDAAGRRVEPGLYLLRWQADGRSGSVRLVRVD